MFSPRDDIEGRLPDIVSLRHELHRIPELGYQETRTAGVIRRELRRLGICAVEGVEGVPTATVAWVGDESRPCVALRADIDALPMTERTGAAYASEHPGRMHACGHDGHTANLIGVAGVLKAMEKQLPVCVKLIWQPAEEGGGGAEKLVQAGVLDGRLGPKVAAIFGLHGWPGLKVGMVATRAGAVLASTDNFTVKVKGRGCHGAYPHLGRDPIATACEMVVGLQQVVSREMDPTEPAAVTVGQIAGGTAVNIIPDEASFSGTSRTLSEPARKQVEEALRRRCEGIAAAGGCGVEVDWARGYPPTVNDPAMADYVATCARAALGESHFLPVARPSLGAEDFAYYLGQAPGCFFLIGVEPQEVDVSPPLHSDRFDFSDAALATGMRMFVELVLRFGRQ